MSKTILVVHAHPEPSSLTRQLVDVSVECLTAQGHRVLQSDLYAMHWKATFDEHDFPERANRQRLSFGAESAHAYRTRRQTPDVATEQEKVLGAFKGKRAMLSVAVGGPAADYAPRGINGPLEQLLFPITHGSLYFPGFDVLPTFAVYGTGSLTAAGAAAAKQAWRTRLMGLFDDAPIPFRPQNGGDYTRTNELKPHVAAGQTGIMAHVAYGERTPTQPMEAGGACEIDLNDYETTHA